MDNAQDYRLVIHERDKIYSPDLHLAVRAMGVRILKTPFRSRQAHSHCQRLIGTLRHSCLDSLIPVNEHHLRAILQRLENPVLSGKAPCEARTRASRGGRRPASATAKTTASNSGGISGERQADSRWSS